MACWPERLRGLAHGKIVVGAVLNAPYAGHAEPVGQSARSRVTRPCQVRSDVRVCGFLSPDQMLGSDVLLADDQSVGREKT